MSLPWVGLWFVIVAFPGHTHLLFKEPSTEEILRIIPIMLKGPTTEVIRRSAMARLTTKKFPVFRSSRL